jgi:hypothetical protein
MILASLHDRHNTVIAHLQASEKEQAVALRLVLDSQYVGSWTHVIDTLASYTLKLGLDGAVFACKVDNGARIQRNVSELVGSLSHGELTFQWIAANIEAAHDLETKLRKNRGRRAVVRGPLIELARHLSAQN